MAHSGPLKTSPPVTVAVRLKAPDVTNIDLIRAALDRHTLQSATRSDAARLAINLVAEILRGLPGSLPDPAYVRSVVRAMSTVA